MPSHPVTNHPSPPVPQGDQGDGMSAGPAHSGALQAAASLCTAHPAVVLCDLPGGVLGCVSPAPLHLAGPTAPTHVALLTQEQVSYDQRPHVSGTKRGSLNKAVPPRHPWPQDYWSLHSVAASSAVVTGEQPADLSPSLAG